MQRNSTFSSNYVAKPAGGGKVNRHLTSGSDTSYNQIIDALESLVSGVL